MQSWSNLITQVFCPVMQSTCRRLKTLVDEALELQYMIKLGASVMCEGPDARRFNVSERMQRLQAYEAARAGDTIEVEELPFIPALVGDMGQLRTSVTTLVVDKIEDGGVRVYVQQMPSLARGIEERHWNLWFSDETSYVVAVDASQDLLIVSFDDDAVIRILTLSTGVRHPHTVFETGMPLPWNVEAEFSGSMEVFGDYCACWVSESAGENWERKRSLVVGNWKLWNGFVKIIPPEPENILRQAVFLNDAYIAVLFSNAADAVLVYSFRTSESHPIKFMLPSTEFGPSMSLIRCCGVSGAEHAGLFHPDPLARMMSMHIRLTVRDRESNTTFRTKLEELLLMIPVDTLLTHVSLPLHVRAEVEVPWSRWGYLGSCLAPIAWGPGSPVGVTGLRMVVSANTEGLAVADYCPVRVAWARLHGAHGLVEEAFDAGDESMRAMLPCVVKEVALPGHLLDYSPFKVMVCEDQLFVLEMTYGLPREECVKAWARTL
ncbi:hypothetical protein FA95DRAFT_1015409 [Auriscalpium vulgare]|uniref:Uncharacterized protein n=1 Tax=Auriscalpium vulgare TaxID=40419 RepID=A0ACB8RWW3_9AGAM|nr:hypothetical protein FA95DRAFT_1015409 [Auriscalpium vulgare]